MHSADAVAYPLVRSRRAGGALAAVWLAGAVGVGAWCASVPAPGLVRAAMLAWTLAAGAAVALWWWRSGAGRLRWDGQAWSTESAEGQGGSRFIAQAQAAVALDFQNLLLLRLCAGRRVRWALADRAAAPERWHGLRCAVTAALYLPEPVAGAEASAR